MAPIHEDPDCAVCNGIQDLSMASLDKKRAACRYFQTGNCRRGSNCPFTHVYISGQVEGQAPAPSHPAYQGEHVYAYHPLGSTPVYRPLGSQAYPIFLWQPYAPPSPSFDPRYGFIRRTEIFADDADDETDPSSAESSSSTVASIDNRTRDTAWLETSATQGTTGPSGNAEASSSPGCAAYGCAVPPAAKAKHTVGRGRSASGQSPGPTVALSSAFSLPWQDGTRKKPLAYKTKSCKFYAANGKCTSGEKCTFIHDREPEGHAESLPKKIDPPIDAELPPKPLNKFDECRARDFYPITWRVIGGGVMMGGQRQICPAFTAGHCKYGDDCKLAHETELETDPMPSAVGFIEPRDESVSKGDRPSRQPNNRSSKKIRSSSQRPKPTKASLATLPPMPYSERTDGHALEGVEAARKRNDEMVVPSGRDGRKLPVRRRTRSMSTVLTSPSPLDATQSNYAAEL